MKQPSNDDGYPGFERCLEMVLSRDAMTFEDGFHWLMGDDWGPRLHGHAGELIALLPAHSDAYTRGKLLELLGYTASREAIPVLVEELAHPDATVRQWAVLSLEELPFREAQELATRYKLAHPGEWSEPEVAE